MGGEPYYVPGIPTPKQKKYGYPASEKYSMNPRFIGEEHSSFSIQLVNKLMTLSLDERFAIDHHDGQYIKKNESRAHHECKLELLIHWADLWSVQNEPVIEY